MDAAEALTGEEAGDILAVALTTRGADLVEWTRVTVHARPGAETSVGFDVLSSEGRVYLIASTVALTAAQAGACGAVRVSSDVGTVHVWIHPADPVLVGLRTACTPELLAEALSDSLGDDIRVDALEVLVLRPLRRAVVRADVHRDGRPTIYFVKVVRPARARSLLRRHRICALAPRAYDIGDGLVVLEPAKGVPMAAALHRPDGSPPARLDPQLVLDALDSLPAEATRMRRRPSVADRLDNYAVQLAARAVDGVRVRTLALELEAELAADDSPTDEPTHGDLHPANVFVDDRDRPRAVTALIDIDTLGPGRRADDHAAFLAHLLAMSALDPAGYPTATATAQEHFEAFATPAERRLLRARVAAHLLALAAGEDGETLEARLALAEDVWSGSLL